MELKDKIVLITGSSSGIGKATAIRFAQEGARVIVNFKENKDGAKETIKEIKELGMDCLLVQADISKPNEVSNLFKKIISKYGIIDILINNAAIPNDRVSYLEATHEDIFSLIDTDLIAPMIVTQFALKHMQKQGYGKILNTSSIRGAEHAGRAVVYAASKSGLNSFTKTLAKIVAPDIQVNAVAPGFVETRNYKNVSEEQIKIFIDQTYLKRWIKEEEIADAFIFLAKNDAITGQVIYVDAGYTLK